MPDITIIKLKIRRGTDSQRKTVVLEQGELGYAIDTGRVYIGDGVTLGGSSISPIFHPPADTQGLKTSTIGAVQGDIINEVGLLYQLKGTDYTQLTGWRFIGTETDNNTIEYINSNQRQVLSIKNNSIDGTKLALGAAKPLGGLRVEPFEGLVANVDNETISINTDNEIKVNKIDENHINYLSFTRGITGGDGGKIGLKIQPNNNLRINDNGYLAYESVNSITVSDINFGGTFNSDSFLNEGNLIQAKHRAVTPPITYNPTTGAVGLDINSDHFETTTNNQLNLKDFSTGLDKTISDGYFTSPIINTYGRVTGLSSTVVDVLSSGSSGDYSIFNGRATEPVAQATIAVRSKNGTGAVGSLSSAGFIVLSGFTTQEGLNVLSRVAIPIFRF